MGISNIITKPLKSFEKHLFELSGKEFQVLLFLLFI